MIKPIETSYKGYRFRSRLEARWAASMVNSPPLDNGEPAWRGERVDGALRIWPEQGIGDQILFARLAPLARARAGRVMLGCDARLAPLFARSFPDIEVVGAEQQPAAAQCAMGSLGAVMSARREDLGGGEAFLRADARAVKKTRARYEAMAGGRRMVGIAWSSTCPGRGEWKSAALSHWRPLLERDVFFVSLQYGEVAGDLAAAGRTRRGGLRRTRLSAPAAGARPVVSQRRRGRVRDRAGSRRDRRAVRRPEPDESGARHGRSGAARSRIARGGAGAAR